MDHEGLDAHAAARWASRRSAGASTPSAVNRGPQAKLYLSKIPMTAFDLLHDRVLPVHEQAGVALERILTDKGASTAGGRCTTRMRCVSWSSRSSIARRRCAPRTGPVP